MGVNVGYDCLGFHNNVSHYFWLNNIISDETHFPIAIAYFFLYSN